jgi:ribose transport system ATP-binding protein
VGIAGLAGSGRTRLAKAIFGALPATGRLAVDGVAVGPFQAPDDAIKAGVAYLPEDRKQSGLALTQSVSANVTLLALSRIRSHGLLSRRRESDKARDLIDQFSIRTSPTGRARVGSLSGGNQQKVVFAKWIESHPRIVILDEPTRGIDIGSKEQIYRLIRKLASEDVAFVLISSELIEVLGMSDRILVMSDGAMVGELEGGATEEDVMRLITSTSHRTVEEGLA